MLTKMGSLLSAPLSAAPHTLPLFPKISYFKTLEKLKLASLKVGLFEILDHAGFGKSVDFEHGFRDTDCRYVA